LVLIKLLKNSKRYFMPLSPLRRYQTVDKGEFLLMV